MITRNIYRLFNQWCRYTIHHTYIFFIYRRSTILYRLAVHVRTNTTTIFSSAFPISANYSTDAIIYLIALFSAYTSVRNFDCFWHEIAIRNYRSSVIFRQFVKLSYYVTGTYRENDKVHVKVEFDPKKSHVLQIKHTKRFTGLWSFSASDWQYRLIANKEVISTRLVAASSIKVEFSI